MNPQPDAAGVQVPSAPVEALAEARDLLDRVEYSPAGLAARLGTGSNLRLQAHDIARRPNESYSLSFRKLENQFRPQRPDGSLEPPIIGTFDFGAPKA